MYICLFIFKQFIHSFTKRQFFISNEKIDGYQKQKDIEVIEKAEQLKEREGTN